MHSLKMVIGLFVALYSGGVLSDDPIERAEGEVIGDTTHSAKVKVEKISVQADTGEILVQTKPRHSTEGRTCTSIKEINGKDEVVPNDFWLRLRSHRAGHHNILSTLLAAHASGKSISVFAIDSDTTDFCTLSRVVLNAN